MCVCVCVFVCVCMSERGKEIPYRKKSEHFIPRLLFPHVELNSRTTKKGKETGRTFSFLQRIREEEKSSEETNPMAIE